MTTRTTKRLAALLLSCGYVLVPVAAETKTIADWFGSCGNLRSCSAYGFSSGSDPVFLRLERGGEAGAEPHWSVNWSLDDVPAGTKVKLGFDDATLPGLPADPVPVDADKSPLIYAVPAANNEAFLASLRKAQALRLERLPPAGTKPADPQADKAEVSLKGAIAMLIWLDEQQKRLDTATAIIRRGPKPASAVPALPPEPVVRAAQNIPPGVLPTKPPTAVAKARKAAECQTDLEGDTAKPTVARLSASAVLWGAPCITGAYNQTALFFILENGTARPARFPRPAGEPDPDPPNHLVNADFDPQTMTMSSFDKGRGVADCGTSGSWVWDGQAFALLSYSDMPECKGVVSDAWPVVFRARLAK